MKKTTLSRSPAHQRLHFDNCRDYRIIAAKANNRFEFISKAMYYTVKGSTGYHPAFSVAVWDIFVTSTIGVTPATVKFGGFTNGL